MKRRLVGLLVAVLLAWRGAASALSLVRELVARGAPADLGAALTLSEDERIRRGLATLEERFLAEARALSPEERARRGVAPQAEGFGLVLGREQALLAALRAHARPGDEVLVVGARTPANGWTYSHVRVLLWPQRLAPVQELPADLNPALAGLRPGTLIAELAPPAELARGGHGFGPAGLARLAEGPGFVLWRAPGARAESDG
jgi:hypothetical protein